MRREGLTGSICLFYLLKITLNGRYIEVLIGSAIRIHFMEFISVTSGNAIFCNQC